MKILMVTPSFEPIVGGTETVVRHLAASLRRMGHQADVLTFNMGQKWHPRWTKETATADGSTVYRWAAINPLASLRLRTLNRLTGRNVEDWVQGLPGRLFHMHVIPAPGAIRLAEGYDVLHLHDETDLVWPFVMRKAGPPRILHCHTIDETYPRLAGSALGRWLLAHAAERYVCMAKSGHALVSRLGVSADQVSVIPNGVDETLFVPDESVRQKNVLLFVGRLTFRKGLHVLLDALKLVRTPCILNVVGFGASDEYRCLLEARIAKLQQLGGHRIYLRGPLQGADLVRQYQQAALFVCPSLLEPFGVVNLEAMACATPVIASATGGILDILGQWNEECLVPPNDPETLALKIECMQGDDDHRIMLGRMARELVEQRYAWHIVADQFVKEYSELCSQQSQNPQ